MKRAIAGLLAGLLVLSLAACHEREVQTQQTPETMQEEAPAPEAKPEEKMPAANRAGTGSACRWAFGDFFLGDGRGFGDGTGRGSAGIFL